MNPAVVQMLETYETDTSNQRKNAMKEVMQEIVLCGLSRAGFFEHAAFYGGTALRIFHGLDRYSEDLDFSLITPDETFDLASFFPILEKEVRSFGLNVEVQLLEKAKYSPIESAFLKGNTREHLLLFYPSENAAASAAPDEKIKIKFEIDTAPPDHASFQRKYRLLPVPYEVNLYDEPSLFAGKILAVLFRGWKNRIKGRDLYDYIFYLSRNTSVNLAHLNARLLQTGFLSPGEAWDIEDLKRALDNKFDAIDYAKAKADVAPFLNGTDSLNLWSADFFKQITEALKEHETGPM